MCACAGTVPISVAEPEHPTAASAAPRAALGHEPPALPAPQPFAPPPAAPHRKPLGLPASLIADSTSPRPGAHERSQLTSLQRSFLQREPKPKTAAPRTPHPVPRKPLAACVPPRRRSPRSRRSGAAARPRGLCQVVMSSSERASLPTSCLAAQAHVTQPSPQSREPRNRASGSRCPRPALL